MSSGPTTTTTGNPADYRLPTDVKPTLYELTIRTDLDKLKFDGFVNVHLDVVKDTSTIVFNSSHLTLGSASITSTALKTTQVHTTNELSLDTDKERATLSLPVTLPAGSTAELKIGFEGELTGSMMGYYRSAWEDNGTKKHYALTQFEPTAARRAFPCWDEPLLKAPFSVTLISREDTVNLGNMPAISEETYEPNPKTADGIVSWLTEKLATLTTSESQASDKWKITKFEKTPPMSTYIVAWANGPFKYLEDKYTSPLSGKTRPLRIYTTPDLIHQAQFALDVKRDVLPHYEKVFDIEYPLPKLDTLVATDFDAGAMENWGLITGRTSAFLLDPKKGNIGSKKAIAVTQSHEVAHMWFGNITTMAWWDNLYLNEGFASLMGEVIILDKVFPEWKVNADFISNHLSRAMGLDAKLSSHPIEVDCPDANMVNQIFDSLSYSKAASVLRMLSNYVGEDKFLKGVSLYLKNHLYGNSVTQDLWKGISEATGVDIPKTMDSWVKQMGFPVVTVKETAEGIHVRQDRFLETGLADEKDNQTLWTIPLSLVTVGADGKASIDRTIVLDEREKTIPLDTSKPYKLNAGTVGLFRVSYPSDRLAKISEEAAKENSIFSLDDRMGLIYDAPALAKAGIMKLSSALTLIENFKTEKEFLVWTSISDSLGNIVTVWWENKEALDGLNALRRDLFGPVVKQLGYEYREGESDDTKELRTKAISAAAFSNQTDVIKELQAKFAEYLKTGSDAGIHPDLERVIYRTAVVHGGKEEFDAIKKLASKPKTPSGGISAMIAMSSTEDDVLFEETWKYIMNEARDGDLIYFFVGFRSNMKYRRLVAEKFKKDYDVLYKRLEGNFALQYLVQYSLDALTTEEDAKGIEEFFKDKDTSKYHMALQQTLDTIRSKAKWINISTDDLLEWLKQRK